MLLCFSKADFGKWKGDGCISWFLPLPPAVNICIFCFIIHERCISRIYNYIRYLGSWKFQATSSNIIQVIQDPWPRKFLQNFDLEKCRHRGIPNWYRVQVRISLTKMVWLTLGPWGHRIASGDARLFTETISRPGCKDQGWHDPLLLLVGRASFSTATVLENVFPRSNSWQKIVRRKLCKLASQQPKDSLHASFLWMQKCDGMTCHLRQPWLRPGPIWEIHQIISSLLQQFNGNVKVNFQTRSFCVKVTWAKR